MTATISALTTVTDLQALLLAEQAAGRRFAGLMGTRACGAFRLSAHVAEPDGIAIHEVTLPAGTTEYPALTPALGAAGWYERELHDRFGLVPRGHPRLEPLIRSHTVPRQVHGRGLFTIAHGPVRSGVMESVEYLVETPGEDIPHLGVRVFYKHRGIEQRFGQLTAADGVLLAERTEGIASVAHALAFSHAVEHVSGIDEVPMRAALIRVLHAELERLVAHLDVVIRLADVAGLAVATARFGVHKERVMRLVGRMCGSRFGRGVVVPGGVRGLPQVCAADVLGELGRLDKAITADARALMGTASFLDRLRRTGPLTPERAAAHGALGPVGKASGYRDDARVARPYDAYRHLELVSQPTHHDGDALARLRVRLDEVRQAFALLRQAAEQLEGAADTSLCVPAESASGRAVGWAEAPHGEVLYDLSLDDGLIVRGRPRSPSFHNLVLFPETFAGDILTDFPFIEASFGLSVAGVAL